MTDHASLNEALLGFQRDAPNLHKDATNPFHKSKFLSLIALMDAVRPVLNEHGLIVAQFPSFHRVPGVEQAVPTLRTRITHAATADFVEDTMPLFLVKDDPQGQGSAITYARRYALMAILGLVADDDDDGEQASGRGKQTRARKPKEETPMPSDEDREAMREVIAELDRTRPGPFGSVPDWTVAADRKAMSVYKKPVSELSAADHAALYVSLLAETKGSGGDGNSTADEAEAAPPDQETLA